MSPAPLDPVRAMKEAITALEEQVKTRVTSVENGRKYQTGGGAEVAIPDGPSIFETTGRVGGFRDAVARPAPVDRHRCRAWLPRTGRTAS